METLRSEVDVELRQLLLRERPNLVRQEEKMRGSASCPPWWKRSCSFYLQQILKLVDAETQLGHAGFEELPQAVLLHQAHKHTEGLLLGHLVAEQRRQGKTLIT